MHEGGPCVPSDDDAVDTYFQHTQWIGCLVSSERTPILYLIAQTNVKNTN